MALHVMLSILVFLPVIEELDLIQYMVLVSQGSLEFIAFIVLILMQDVRYCLYLQSLAFAVGCYKMNIQEHRMFIELVRIVFYTLFEVLNMFSMCKDIEGKKYAILATGSIGVV